MKIEKGIPVKKRHRWPFREMEIGDSFLIPEGSRNSAAVAASKYRARSGYKFMFCIRKTECGYRCWRTE